MRALLEPRKHRHVWMIEGVVDIATGERTAIRTVCERCDAVRDEARARAGRNARKRGNRYELDVARAAGGVKVGHHGGPEDVLIGGAFAVQAKLFAAGRFPGWMADELARLPRTDGRTPLLVIGEAGVAGKRRRALAVLDYADFLDLHGQVTS